MPRIARSRPWQTIPSIVLPVGLTVVLFVLTLFLVAIPTLHSQLMQRRKDMIRELTQTAWGMVATYHQDEQAGRSASIIRSRWPRSWRP
jgi:hypothetical protein